MLQNDPKPSMIYLIYEGIQEAIYNDHEEEEE